MSDGVSRQSFESAADARHSRRHNRESLLLMLLLLLLYRRACANCTGASVRSTRRASASKPKTYR